MEIISGAGKISAGYDRMKELKAFDDTKAGVKGQADAGLSKIPRIFARPPDELAKDTKYLVNCEEFENPPVIDLEGVDQKDDRGRRKEIVEEVRRASEKWGFFQLVNHGIPISVMEEMIRGVLRFNEEDLEAKKEFYGRDTTRKVQFNSNFDLYTATSANWRDTLGCSMFTPDPLNPQELPEICRDIILEFTKNIMNVGETLNELLSESLGLKSDHLKAMDCNKFMTIACHYYPACPEPELTLGASRHSDPSFFTVLLQDDIGGLQFLHQDRWVNAKPIPGALIVNIGDILQLISNDKLKSVEHRVVSNHVGPRVSVACFFNTNFNTSTKLYGPIKEILSEDNPPVYRDFLLNDYTNYYNAKGLDGVSALNYFKL